MNETQIKQILKSKLSPRRFIHTLSVQELAIKLATNYKLDKSKASLAGLLHDCAKWMLPEELLRAVERYGIKLDEVERQQIPILHSIVGSYWAKEKFQVHDEEILRAIRLHTTGNERMALLDQVIYVADYAEPTREYIGANSIYKLAFENIDMATLKTANQKILHLIKKDVWIHSGTIKMRNAMLTKLTKHYPRR